MIAEGQCARCGAPLAESGAWDGFIVVLIAPTKQRSDGDGLPSSANALCGACTCVLCDWLIEPSENADAAAGANEVPSDTVSEPDS
jgi:hypothetical protein